MTSAAKVARSCHQWASLVGFRGFHSSSRAEAAFLTTRDGAILMQEEATRFLAKLEPMGCSPRSRRVHGNSGGIATSNSGTILMQEEASSFLVNLDALKRTPTDSLEQEASAAAQPSQAPSSTLWRPDPSSGFWLPENMFGAVTNAPSAGSATPVQTRSRSWPRASMDEQSWWRSSLEDAPERFTPRVQ